MLQDISIPLPQVYVFNLIFVIPCSQYHRQAWIWDFMMSLHEEYLLFAKSRIKVSDIVYILARYVTWT